MLKSIQLSRFAISPVIQCRVRINCATRSCNQILCRIPEPSFAGPVSKPRLPNVHSASPLFQYQTVSYCADVSSEKYKLIYALPTITVLRTLSRLKIIQTGITAVMLPPVYYLFLQGELSLSIVLYSTGIAAFAAAMLYSISLFARRVVGRMYLDSAGTTLKVSHLTFWGRRNDLYMPVSDVMTFGDVGDSPNETIFYLKRFSTKDIMYFSTRLGRVVDKSGFEKVFGKLT